MYVGFQTIFQQYFTIYSSRNQGQSLWKQVISLCFPLQQQKHKNKCLLQKMVGIFVLTNLMLYKYNFCSHLCIRGSQCSRRQLKSFLSLMDVVLDVIDSGKVTQIVFLGHIL